MKEIIINGVDVSECKYATKSIPIDCENNTCFCYEDANCYYKQLKRTEIEIEKLKGVDGSVHPDSAYYKISRLEQENAELKAENKIARQATNKGDFGIMSINEYEYKRLCDEWSSKLLQRIICPCCGHVYSIKNSIDIAFCGDCEDTISFNCEECGEELVVKVWATEYRVSTQKASDHDKEYAKRLKGILE